MNNNNGVKQEFLSQIADKIANVMNEEFEKFITKKFNDNKNVSKNELKSLHNEWKEINEEIAERIKISGTFTEAISKRKKSRNTKKIIVEFKKKTTQLADELSDIDTTLFVENLIQEQEKMKLLLK